MKLLKKLLVITIIIMSSLVLMPQMQNKVQAVVKISATKKTMYKGYTYKLKVTGTNKKIKWSSSDKSKATVNSKGKVYVKKNGKVTITAKVGGKKYNCKVTIKNKPYKLKQFSTTFYDLKDVAKKFKYIGEIKNYGEYKYDLDGDGKKDVIMVKRVEEYDKELDYVDVNFVLSVNGKKIDTLSEFSNLYVVDLNKSDKALELIIETQPVGDAINYMYDIYQKKNNSIKKIADTEKLNFPNEQIKVNQKGKIVGRDCIEAIFSPYIVSKYFELNNGKISKINTLYKNVAKLDFKTKKEYGGIGNEVYFTTNKKNIGKENKSQIVKKGTKFNLLSMSFKPDVDGSGCTACKVKLSNGKVGYLYVLSSY